MYCVLSAASWWGWSVSGQAHYTVFALVEISFGNIKPEFKAILSHTQSKAKKHQSKHKNQLKVTNVCSKFRNWEIKHLAPWDDIQEQWLILVQIKPDDWDDDTTSLFHLECLGGRGLTVEVALLYFQPLATIVTPHMAYQAWSSSLKARGLRGMDWTVKWLEGWCCFKNSSCICIHPTSLYMNPGGSLGRAKNNDEELEMLRTVAYTPEICYALIAIQRTSTVIIIAL